MNNPSIGKEKIVSKKNKRKNSIEIIDGIYKALQDGNIHTISNISRQANAHWKTIKNHINIIARIQELPKIEILKASNQTLVRII
jgi:hypothetical protein